MILEPLATFRVELAPILRLGRTRWGDRRVIDIVGGSFSGPRLNGTVLPGGADWQVVHDDGSAGIDTRYTLRTDDGALLYIQTQGVRHGPPATMARLAAGEEVDPPSTASGSSSASGPAPPTTRGWAAPSRSAPAAANRTRSSTTPSPCPDQPRPDATRRPGIVTKLDRPAIPITTVLDQPVEMRDGTVLRADVYRPADGEPRRTVLVRSPYGEPAFRRMPIVPYLRAGLAVVMQHCRGRGGSDGEFTPWVDEGRDGVDTVEWITAQPWSNGEVVAAGMSYLAGCALQLASERPAALKAVVATMTPHDFYDGLKYHGGAFALGSAFHWGSLQGMLGALHAMSGGQDAAGRIGALLPVLADPVSAMSALPLRDAPGVCEAFPFWRDWVDHPERDAYWAGLAETLRHDRIEVPVLHTAGWFDLFLPGTLENHRRIPGGRLIIGPWTHLSQEAGAGELNFGFAASAMAAMLEPEQVGFLCGVTGGPKVKYFTMGAGVWREAESWPPPGIVETRYHLHSDGSLSPDAPAGDAPPSRFVHDPGDPVPTHGGPLLLPDPVNVGPRDQRAIEERPDVLCFTTPVLDRDVEVTGPLKVVLHAATSAAGSDWTAKLVDVWPDGRAMSVIDGIVRSPGDRLEHEIDLVATSQTFRAGHRIRVEIASSNFPRFDRHPAMTRAEQTVFHDAARPSWISLPIMPG